MQVRENSEKFLQGDIYLSVYSVFDPTYIRCMWQKQDLGCDCCYVELGTTRNEHCGGMSHDPLIDSNPDYLFFSSIPFTRVYSTVVVLVLSRTSYGASRCTMYLPASDFCESGQIVTINRSR